jgi:hypothetical protein
MKFRPIELACTCGEVPREIQSIGLTSEYELVVHWTCANCKQIVYALKTLTDCCRECPDAEELEEAVVNGRRATEAEDARFLQNLGIRFPDD